MSGRRPLGGSGELSRSIVPVAALLVGYPLWWALGIQMLMWGIVGAWVAAWVYSNRDRLAIPVGFGWLIVFLGWALISAFTLTGAKYALSYGFRLTLYFSVILIGFQVFNLVRSGFLRPDQLQVWLLCFWGFAVVLSIPGLLTSTSLRLDSPFGLLLSGAGIRDKFIDALTSVRFSSVDSLYGIPRPSPMFEFTNAWGAAMGVLTPVAMYALVTTTSRRRRWLIAAILVLSIWPIVVSLNRGCWVSIAVACGYVAARRTFSGHLRASGLFLAALAALGTVVVLTPLEGFVADRLATANTGTRANLYSAALQLAAQSPFFGYGAPQSSALVANNNDVSIGTHGQLWTILVSHGYIGLALFVVGVLSIWWLHRPVSGRNPDVWLHATGVVVLFQMFVYDIVPVPMMVFFCAHAVIAENRRRQMEGSKPPAAEMEGNPVVLLR